MNRSDTTFTIPFIASLFLTRFPIKNAIVTEHIVNTKEFIIYIKPFIVNITFPTNIKLKITYIAHRKIANKLFAKSKHLLCFL